MQYLAIKLSPGLESCIVTEKTGKLSFQIIQWLNPIDTALKLDLVTLPCPQMMLRQGYVFTPVCDSVHRWMCLPHCMLGCIHPPRQTPLARHLLGRHHQADTPKKTPLRQTPPSRQTPLLLNTTVYGQQVGSTHPTRMHTCL